MTLPGTVDIFGSVYPLASPSHIKQANSNHTDYPLKIKAFGQLTPSRGNQGRSRLADAGVTA